MLDTQTRTYATSLYGVNLQTATQDPVLIFKMFSGNSTKVDEHANLHQQLENEREQRKRAEEALRACQAELARASRVSLLGRLAATIAHEVKQPMAAIVLNARAGLQMLDPGQVDTTKVRESLHAIIAAGVHAGDVVRSVCNLAKSNTVASSDVRVEDSIHAVLTLLHGELDKHQVTVHTHLDPQYDAVAADPVQLHQVLLNLVLNAIDAMKAVSGRARQIKISTWKADADGMVNISVEDSGTGIDAGSSERIFEALFSTKAEGMGIGLPVCRSIVEAHGGKIWVTAHQPHGAAFHISLPRAACRLDASQFGV